MEINDLLGPFITLKLLGLGLTAMAAYYYVDYKLNPKDDQKSES